MAIRKLAQSVSDATRFTSTTPHVWSAAAAASVRRATSPQAAFASSSSSSSVNNKNARFQSPASGSKSSSPAARSAQASRRGPAPPGAGGPRPPPGRGPAAAPIAGETPEQKVARLRAAHQAAKNAQVSSIDRMISGTRRVFDNAHRFTIIGLIGFTAIAGLLTAYTTVDMLRFNSRRKKEFMAAQQQMEADSLAAARLAFMRGDATPEQVLMVEAANAQAVRDGLLTTDGKTSGGASASGGEEAIFKVPSLLGAPAPIKESTEKAEAAAASEKKSGGVRSWFSSTLSREEEGEAAGSSQRRLGYESLCEEDDATGVRESDVVRALEQKQKAAAAAYQAISDRAQQALEKEKTNQREGGPLDRLGLDEKNNGTAATPAAPAPKKSWW
ncbi:hypothetical protein Sste5346_003942 [Sporothrix stenoceras]|uniref:Cytochrome oxidase c assembly-domain-containing protein n=1 Tax=Sporothrix stenoceras TaxID=5173 RepID=A0ABR3ZAG2_9PEZI